MEQKYTFFWSGVFSQWYKSNFEINSVVYSNSEKYMMSQKALLFKDFYTYGLIMDTNNPKECKALGRQVKNFNVDVWNNVARSIVYVGNFAKFTQNKDLLNELMKTKGTILVEASPFDSVWGIGMSVGDPLINNSKNWKGTNWLGEVLTQVRNDIFSEYDYDCQKCQIYDCEAFSTLFDKNVDGIKWSTCKRK